MAKRQQRSGRSPAPAPAPVPAEQSRSIEPKKKLLRRSDLLWLVACLTLLLTAFQLCSPDTNVSDAQIVGLGITIAALAVLSRHWSNHWRAKRAK